jgi:hypothetical protein
MYEGDDDPRFNEDRAMDFFRAGAQAAREMMARFVEQGGDAVTAASIRANWHPGWGKNPGKWDGDIPTDCWHA